MPNGRATVFFKVAIIYFLSVIGISVVFYDLRSIPSDSKYHAIGSLILLTEFMYWKNIPFTFWKGNWKSILKDFGLKLEKEFLIKEIRLGVVGGVAAFVITSRILFPYLGYPANRTIHIGSNIALLLIVFLYILIVPSLVGPILEEVLFRGYLINRFRQIFGVNSKKVAFLAGVISVITFSWFHKDMAVRIPRAIIYTVIYLWNDENKLAAAMSAHATSNFLNALLLINFE